MQPFDESYANAITADRQRIFGGCGSTFPGHSCGRPQRLPVSAHGL
jgi:hypothetical protein